MREREKRGTREREEREGRVRSRGKMGDKVKTYSARATGHPPKLLHTMTHCSEIGRNTLNTTKMCEHWTAKGDCGDYGISISRCHGVQVVSLY